METLEPVRIPGGWLVRYNDFFTPIAGADASSHLKEDLLQLHNSQFDVLVDLGWYGTVEDGSYGLVAHRGDFTGPELHHFRSTLLSEVVGELEGLLLRVSKHGFHLAE